MRAKTQKAIGGATAGILAVLSGYRLVSDLNLLAPHQFAAWFPSTSLVLFVGTSVTFVLSCVYVYAIIGNKTRTVELVCRVWLAFGLVGLIGALFTLASTGILTKSFGVLLMMSMLLLRVGLPFVLITLLWWTGLKGLERNVESDGPAEACE